MRPTPEGATLRAIDTTSTSTRLTWPAKAGAARYAIVLDGRTIGWSTSVRARIIGLRPNTPYEVTIAVRAGVLLRPYTGSVTLRTAPVTRPTPDGLFQLTNALTGGAAQLYGARGNTNTPLVLGRRDTTVNQRWELVPAPGGAFLLRNRATGGCAVPRGAAIAGAVVVQQPCATGDAAQRWRLGRGATGVTLIPGTGKQLVLGVSRLRFGGQHLLVLQRGDNSRYQSWTALPV